MSVDDENQESNFQKLKEEYRKTIPGKLEALDSLIKALQKKGDLATLTELRLLVHKIAGSSGVYGYAHSSEIGKKFADALALMIEKFPQSLEEGNWIGEMQSYMQQIKEAYGKN